MFDKLEAKIHEIREQPEHIRMRYVWGALVISMGFIIFIWLLSMRMSFFKMTNDMKKKQTPNDIQKRIEEIRTTTPNTQKQPISIDDLLEQTSTSNDM